MFRRGFGKSLGSVRERKRWVVRGMATFDVFNPATGAKIDSVLKMGVSDAKRAVSEAGKIMNDWKENSSLERSRVCFKVEEILLEKREELAALITAEAGKTIKEARGEVAYASSYFRYFGEQVHQSGGATLPTWNRGLRGFTFREPVGVCALITPWNFPLAMLARKLSPAMAAGCTSVCLPASETPLSAMRLAEIVEEAGGPKVGVVTTIREEAPNVGRYFAHEASVRKLSFTGSIRAGQTLAEQCGKTLKKLSLELGGKAPILVMEDADLEKAATGIMQAKFRNAGQTCVAANHVIVHDSVADDLVHLLSQKINDLVLGNGAYEEVDVGPLISEAAVRKSSSILQDAVSKGAKIVAGGRGCVDGSEPTRIGDRPKPSQTSQFFEPALLDNVTDNMDCLQSEVFGPILPIHRVSSQNQALQIANSGNEALAGYIFTESLSRAIHLSERLQVGMIGLNTGLFSAAEIPFGGNKFSGIGREGGPQGLDEYTTTKSVIVNIH